LNVRFALGKHGNISVSIRHHFLENNMKASEQLHLKNLREKVICICNSKFIFPNILYFVHLGMFTLATGKKYKISFKSELRIIYCLVALICDAL
jgi:hypothetical protein